MKHALRIATVVIGAALYAPIMATILLRIVGPQAMQGLFDWIIGRGCGGAACYLPRQIGLLAFVATIALTLPAMIWIGILWVRRSLRSDTQVSGIETYFVEAPERIHPATVGVEPEEKRFYRDRQGRLRPMESNSPDG